MTSRTSTYLVQVKLASSYVFINTLTGALDELSPEVVASIGDGTLDADSEAHLVARGHLTRLDEPAEHAYAMRAWKAIDEVQGEAAQVVICPSLDCNFRCVYCFERELQNDIDGGTGCLPQAHMSLGQVEKIFSSLPFLEQRHESVVPQITLYGGEPLWPRNFAVVSDIVRRARERKYGMAAVTNGHELETFRPLLGKNGISSLQVTLDGPPDIHDRMRPTACGQGTFERIISQIRSVADVEGLRINIRMNYDTGNVNRIPDLVSLLNEREVLSRPNVDFYATLISMNHAGKSRDYATLKSLPQLSAGLKDYDLDCHTAGLRRLLASALDARTPFHRRTRYCGAMKSQYVFTPDGRMYACWEALGKEHSCLGTYDPEFSFNEPVMERWHGRNALTLPKCQTCSHLFLCGGGCGIHGVQRNGDLYQSECDGFKKKFDIMASRCLESRLAAERFQGDRD